MRCLETEVCMKKTITLFGALALSLSFLTSCGSEKVMLTSQDYEWDETTTQTTKGVSVGDDKDAFLASYGEYDIFTSTDGSTYEMLDPELIPFDEPITTILPTFIIDGVPTDLDKLCKENEIAKSDVMSLFSSTDYLSQHTVIYYYLAFTWKDGIITAIDSKSMDYNEDAAYYQDIR